jgi:hypothetical protein
MEAPPSSPPVIDLTDTTTTAPLPAPTTASDKKPEARLADADVRNEIAALNLMVQFLGLAQKRGAFTIDEAAKIWECVKMFQKPVV